MKKTEIFVITHTLQKDVNSCIICTQNLRNILRKKFYVNFYVSNYAEGSRWPAFK